MSRGWKIVGWVAFGALFIVLIGGATMALWNWLVPTLFNGPLISFWQAMGLLVLAKILFGGFGKGHCHRPEHRMRGNWKGMYDKFSAMSPEERDAFKKKMKEKWCRYDENTSEPKSDDTNG